MLSIIGDVQEATDQFMEAVEERIKFVVRKLREYVNDYKMQQILMKPIEVKKINNIQISYNICTNIYKT
jgi:hypothetical protein